MQTVRKKNSGLISEEELHLIGEAETTPGGLCNEIRPGTLGHQMCWRINDHTGAHISQDREAWTTT